MVAGIQAWLKEASKRGTTLVTVDELDRYRQPEDMKLSDYQALRHELADFAADAGIIYAYYLRPATDGYFQFIIDNDFDESTRVGLDTAPGEVALTPGLMGALEGMVSVADIGSYMVGWEGLISAYAPIFDNEGNVVAVCGVDINDMMLYEAKLREEQLGILSIVAAWIVFTSGALCFAAYRRETRIANRAKEAFAEHAQSIISINEMKTEFIRNISHEMKTPLTVISTNILNADDQLDFEADKDEMRDNLQNAQQEIMRMAQMIDSALKYASIHPGQAMGSLNVVEVLFIAAKIHYTIAEQCGNVIMLDISEQIIPIYGNADMLLQALSSLLSNAIRHTQDGEIIISATADKDAVIVTIRDNGEGVKPEILQSIFERGVSTSGSGLGLSICKSVIDNHQGKITIESEPGKGTIATIILPLHIRE
jgi:signal transduction histidine kinase